MLKGVDISHHNNYLIKQFVGRVDFVFCKATQGGTYKDPEFNQYWQDLKKTQIQRGAYHFLDVRSTAKEQADNFLSLGIDFSKPNVLPPVLDVENQVPASLDAVINKDKAAFAKMADDWISIVSKATGRKVIVYTYKNFLSGYMNNWARPDHYLWLASYQKTEPGLPKGYSKYEFWQYSDHGTLAGATTGGDLDLDYFNGTLAQLKAL